MLGEASEPNEALRAMISETGAIDRMPGHPTQNVWFRDWGYDFRDWGHPTQNVCNSNETGWAVAGGACVVDAMVEFARHGYSRTPPSDPAPGGIRQAG